MQRRHFIKLTGVSLGSMLLFRSSGADGHGKLLVALPGKVFIKLDDGEHELQSADKLSWTYHDVMVQLRYAGDALRVQLHSPKDALHVVRMQWEYDQPATTKFLGDHWERTYGDLFFQPASSEKKLPWYFIQHDDQSTTCFGVKTGCNSICHWNIGDGRMHMSMDVRNGGSGVELGDRLLHAADIISTKNKDGENSFATARRFCGMMCDKPRLARHPVYGINDWYYAYGNNSPKLILEQTALLTALATDTYNRPFSVIDAGWAHYSTSLPGDCCWGGDFSRPNDKFKDMQSLAADIRKLGMRPALWTRPLCAADEDNKNLLLPVIAGRENPKNPVLDPSLAENIERIKRNISIYKQWGYEMVKHDFSTFDMLGKWGFQMAGDITSAGWHFNDRSKTTAEIILQLYTSIREAAADMYLIGCNTMSHLSAGIFEVNRIGDDTSGKEWARTRKMGVNTLGFRLIQHNHFYAADGDCVGLTKDVPWEKNKQWMQLVAESGTPLFISAQPDALGDAQKKSILEYFAIAAKKLPVGEPMDWLTNQLPAKWKLNGNVQTFDWS